MDPVLSPSENELHRIRIVLVDDHPLMRQALRMWIEKQQDMEVIAEANDGKEAAGIAANLAPDVVIMDISMPRLNGLDATKRIKAIFPRTEVLVLSVHTDVEHILSMMQAGASGYITKNVSGEEVIHAVRAVADGENLFPPSIKQDIIEGALCNPEPLPPNKLDQLTDRELAILRLVANGMTNKAIALRLGLTLRTVKGNLTTLFLKLNVVSRTQAIVSALKTGIITPGDLNQSSINRDESINFTQK